MLFSQPFCTLQRSGLFPNSNYNKYKDHSQYVPLKHTEHLSNNALQATASAMSIDQTIHLYKDLYKLYKAISRGKSTNSVISKLKGAELVSKCKEMNPIDNYIQINITGSVGHARTRVYERSEKFPI